MKTHQELGATGRIQGSLFRLRDGREIAIYLREGVPSVVEFRRGLGELFTASGWMSVNGPKLVHAQRKGVVETESPIPAAVAQCIETLHAGTVASDKNSTSPRLAHLASLLAEPCAGLWRRCFCRVGFSSGDSAA